MPISPECGRCDEELQEPGGLLFGPPDRDGKSMKRHLCVGCYQIVLADINRTWSDRASRSGQIPTVPASPGHPLDTAEHGGIPTVPTGDFGGGKGGVLR